MNSATRAALLALVLGGVPASAQTPDTANPQSAPRSIVPPVILVPRAPPPESALAQAVEPDAAPTEPAPAPEAGAPEIMTEATTPLPGAAAEPMAPEPPMGGRFNSSAVVVGDLGTVEGPIAGTLDGTDGFGDDVWARSDRTTVIGMLQTAPAATPSAAASLLLRKAILTTAVPPPGRSDRSFNALRLSKLLDAGLVNDAADLAARVQAPMNPEILQLQADAFIRSGRDFDACGDLTALRLQSAERFWVQLRAYCYAVNRDLSALELTRTVIADQGLSDPAFLTLLDGLASGQAMAPETIALPDSLHILMLARLNLPMNLEIATGLGLADSLMAAASIQTPPALRIAAAEKALRAGALPTDLLAQVLELTSFAPGDLAGASALARAEPLMPALARLRAAVRMTPNIEQRADLIHTALEIGQSAGLLRQVALLFVARRDRDPPRLQLGQLVGPLHARVTARGPPGCRRALVRHLGGERCRISGHRQSTPADADVRRSRAGRQLDHAGVAARLGADGQSATACATRAAGHWRSIRSHPIWRRCPSRRRRRRLHRRRVRRSFRARRSCSGSTML